MNALSLLSTIDCRWLLEEGYYNALLATLEERSLASLLIRPDGTATIEARSQLSSRMAAKNQEQEERPYLLDGNIALIALDGPLTKKASWLSYYYGGASTLDTLCALQQAGQDQEVNGICLLIDSPGGQVAGTFDLADEVARVAQSKPVYAYVSDLCASAAYAVASQASKVVGNRTALVGSIGTYMALRDSSKMYEEAGITTHVVRAGKHKGAGTPGTQVTKEHLAEFQRNVDDLNQQFLATVATGRSLSPDQVAELADGRVHVGQDAVTLGLMNAVASFEECLDTLKTVTRATARLVW